MVISLFYFIASVFLQAAAFLFNSLNYAPPIASVFNSISYFLSYTKYFSGVIDLPVAYSSAGIAIGFEVFWFFFLICWYVIGFFKGLFSRGSSQH